MTLEGRMAETKTPLKYDDYQDNYFCNNNDFMWKPGIHQWLFKFDNNYGASVIKHFGSYGFENDLFELAVLKFDDNNDWDLCYETPITDNVIGNLTNDEVLDCLERIRKL